MNPYAVLGVDRDADADAVRKAYLKLAKKYHPDVNKDPKAETKFKEVNAAYEAVGDPEKRKLFDEFGEQSLRTGFDAEDARRWKAATQGGRGPFGGAGYGDGVDMEDLLGSLFGSGAERGARPRRGADQHAELALDFMMTVTGGEVDLRLRKPDGSLDALKVRVPAGAKDGGKLKLKGHGLPPRGGGPTGDLHVTLRVQPHPLLRRDEDDLELDVPLTVEEAIFGSSIAVPTPTGDVKVSVPPGVATGTRLRIKGRGIQKSTPGDLFLVLRPTVPASEDPAVREAARVISAAYKQDVRAELKL